MNLRDDNDDKSPFIFSSNRECILAWETKVTAQFDGWDGNIE